MVADRQRFSGKIVLLADKGVVVEHVKFFSGAHLLPTNKTGEAIQVENFVSRLSYKIRRIDALRTSTAFCSISPAITIIIGPSLYRATLFSISLIVRFLFLIFCLKKMSKYISTPPIQKTYFVETFGKELFRKRVRKALNKGKRLEGMEGTYSKAYFQRLIWSRLNNQQYKLFRKFGFGIRPFNTLSRNKTFSHAFAKQFLSKRFREINPFQTFLRNVFSN